MAAAAPPVTAIAGGTGRVLGHGTLLAPNNTINVATGTIALKASFPNADNRLWPGQFVTARIQVGELHGAVTVPDVAIEDGPSGLYVYVVQSDDTAKQASVKAGYSFGGRTVITSGLTPGEVIVLTDQSRVSPGAKVSVVAPTGSGS